MRFCSCTIARASALILALGWASLAQADGPERTAPLSPQYVQECAACHIAYMPSLLPAASWKRIMATLPQHFGTDASLDSATTQDLTAWITARAARGRRASEEPAQDRITRSTWFMRQHDEVPATVWKRPTVKTAANCSACHPGSTQGDFNEHRVRIPR